MSLVTLRTEIQKAKVPAAGSDSKLFVPEGYLQEHLTFDDIESILSDSAFEIPRHKQESTARVVIEAALKIFAILVDLNVPHKLSSFIESNVLETSLPPDEDLLRDLIPQAWANFRALQWGYLAHRFRKASIK